MGDGGVHIDWHGKGIDAVQSRLVLSFGIAAYHRLGIDDTPLCQ